MYLLLLTYPSYWNNHHYNVYISSNLSTMCLHHHDIPKTDIYVIPNFFCRHPASPLLQYPSYYISISDVTVFPHLCCCAHPPPSPHMNLSAITIIPHLHRLHVIIPRLCCSPHHIELDCHASFTNIFLHVNVSLLCNRICHLYNS